MFRNQEYNSIRIVLICLVVFCVGLFVYQNSIHGGILQGLVFGVKSKVTQTIETPQAQNSRLYTLAQTDPQAFYNQAKSANISGTLSSSNQFLVGKPVTLTGTIRASHADDFSNKTEIDFYQFTSDNGKTWIRIEPINKLPDFETEEMTTDVSGYEINNLLVGTVVPRPLLNPISVQSNLKPLQIAQHPLNVAVILVRYQDSGSEIFSSTDAQNIIFTNSQWTKFYKEQSYGKVSFTGDTYGWYTLPENMPAVCPQFDPPDHIITDNEIELEGYDFVFILLDCRNQGAGTGISWGGTGDLGLQSSLGLPGGMGIINPGILGQWYPNNPLSWSFLDRIFAHELGHALGNYYTKWSLYHSHGYDCGSNLPIIPLMHITACKSSEYGDLYDEMGVGTFGHHFGAYLKNYLGWIPDSNVLTIAHSGTYSLQPIEEIGATVGRIQLGNSFPYYLEYRKPIGFDQDVKEGLYLHYVDHFDDLTGSPENQVFLLDLHPTSTDWGTNAEDVALSGGDSYTDAINDITIKVKKVIPTEININERFPSKSSKPLTFDITFGNNYLCHQKPVIEFSNPKILYIDATHFTIPFKIVNKDSYRCTYSSTKNMSYTINYPASFTLEQSYNQNPFELSGSETDWLLFDVTVPMDLITESYPFTLTVKNDNNLLLTASATVYWGTDSNIQDSLGQNTQE